MSIFAAKGLTTVCFPQGTLVHTENGLARIEDLKVGDQVLTFNEQTQKQEYKPILVTHQRYTMQMSGLEISGGEMLRVTPEHRFYTNGEWIEARALQAGDLLQNKDGDYVTILSIETVPHYEKVYNFDVQDNENYYVTEEGILVHNGYGKGEGLEGNNWAFDETKDIDMRGGADYRNALDEAFERTGIPKEDFEVTKWGTDVNGKAIPVEYQGPNGAQVNMDIPEWNNVKPNGKLGEGPHSPHIGYQTPGKGKNRIRGHIFVDEVPATRS